MNNGPAGFHAIFPSDDPESDTIESDAVVSEHVTTDDLAKIIGDLGASLHEIASKSTDANIVRYASNALIRHGLLEDELE